MILYALIGKTLHHSFSASFFTNEFADKHICASYINCEMPSVEGVGQMLAERPALRGFNVTIPYKRDIIPLLDTVSPRAARIGAVNTVVVERTGNSIKLHGYNSDAPGFRDSLLPILPENRSGLKALILGTGGASAAVADALDELDITYTFVSRNCQGKNNCIAYSDITEEEMETHRIIINTTPLGTTPDTASAPPIPYGMISKEHICHDLVYNPAMTRFMRLCADRGATVKNGLEMLHNQALLSYILWTGTDLRTIK